MQQRTKDKIIGVVVLIAVIVLLIALGWGFFLALDTGDRRQRDWCKDKGGIVVDTDGDNTCIDASVVIEKDE